jgi:uncharacterized membrane protein
MTWRGSTTPSDRLFACLPYLLPLLDGLVFGGVLLSKFPFISTLPVIGQLLSLLLQVRGIFESLGSIGQLIVFFAVYIFVVRNDKINHFIRFNAMQAILLDIVIFLCSLLLQFLGYVPGIGFAIETLVNTVFLGVVATVVYSVFQSVFGRYAEIPVVSEAAYMQVR